MPFFLPALLWGAAQGGKTGLQNKEKGKKREAKQGTLDELSKLLLAGQGGPADPGFGQSAAGAPTAANPGGAQAASVDPEMQRWIQGLMAVAGSGAEGQDTAIAQMLKTLMPDAAPNSQDRLRDAQIREIDAGLQGGGQMTPQQQADFANTRADTARLNALAAKAGQPTQIAPNVSTDIVTNPDGTKEMVVFDKNTNEVTRIPVTNKEAVDAARLEKKKAGLSNKITPIVNVLNKVNKIIDHPGLNLASNKFDPFGGVSGSLGLFSDEVKDVKSLINSLQSSNTLGTLAALKAASEGGSSGLGPVSKVEFEALEKSIAELKLSQGDVVIKRNLNVIREHMSNVIALQIMGAEGVDDISKLPDYRSRVESDYLKHFKAAGGEQAGPVSGSTSTPIPIEEWRRQRAANKGR